MFKKKRSSTKLLQEEFVDTQLPVLSNSIGYIAHGYKYNDPEYTENLCKKTMKTFEPLVKSMDKHNSGTEAYGYIDAEILNPIKADFENDCAWADYQSTRIQNVTNTRLGKVERVIEKLETRLEKIEEEREPLKEYKAHNEIQVFGKHVSMGLLINIFAIVSDVLVTYPYLESVVTMGGLFLFVSVLAMAITSNCSMSALGNIWSTTDESFMSKRTRIILSVSYLLAFGLSVVAGPMIKFGSMDQQFGTISASGQFIAREGGYTMAEYGITLITSFLTAFTGLLCFHFNHNRNRDKVLEKRKLEKEKCTLELDLENALTEREAILGEHQAAMRLDQEKRKAAINQISILPEKLKSQFTRTWAETSGTAEIVEKAAKTVENMLEESESSGVHREDKRDNINKIHKMAV